MRSLLEVSMGGNCDWVKRQPSVSDHRREVLAEEIRAIRTVAKRRYGSPRMRAECEVRGHPRSVNLVVKVMNDLRI